MGAKILLATPEWILTALIWVLRLSIQIEESIRPVRHKVALAIGGVVFWGFGELSKLETRMRYGAQGGTK